MHHRLAAPPGRPRTPTLAARLRQLLARLRPAPTPTRELPRELADADPWLLDDLGLPQPTKPPAPPRHLTLR